MISVHKVRQILSSITAERWCYLGWLAAAAGFLSWLAVPGKRAARAAARLAEAHARGDAASTLDYVAYWVPRAAVMGLVVVGVLLLATRWLARPLPEPEVASIPQNPSRSGRLLAGFAALLMLWSGMANAPRLDFGLWGDEEATMRKSVVGQYERDKSGALVLDAPDWTETVFRYRDPNNHPFNSVVSRLSHTALAGDLKNPEGFYFDARALRWPVFVAGLLGLAATAWVGWVAGAPLAGALATLLLALHPWFVRYGVECRGYGFQLLFVPLALGALIRSVQTGSWRWWALYGLCQVLILWSYPGALHQLVVLNISAAAAFLTVSGRSRDWRLAQAGRWFAVCALGAVVCTVLMAPLVQPLLIYLKTPRMQGPMPGSWYGDSLAWLTTGMPLVPWEAENPLCWSWQQALPAWWGAGFALIVIALAAGAWGWWRQGGILRALLPALLLHAPLFALQTFASGGFSYSWYIMPALTGIVLLAGGIALLPVRTALVSSLVLLGIFTLATMPATRLLREYPVEQMQEGTKLTRRISLASDPRIDDVLTVDIAMTPRGYDPAALPLSGDDVATFRSYLAQADAGQKPLFIHLGSRALALQARPGVMQLIDNSSLFEYLATLPGMDKPYTREVFRYRPGSLAKP